MTVLDLVMLILTAAAFAAAGGYVWACDSLTGERRLSSEEAP
jgi:hypothetical protein